MHRGTRDHPTFSPFSAPKRPCKSTTRSKTTSLAFRLLAAQCGSAFHERRPNQVQSRPNTGGTTQSETPSPVAVLPRLQTDQVEQDQCWTTCSKTLRRRTRRRNCVRTNQCLIPWANNLDWHCGAGRLPVVQRRAEDLRCW